MALPHFHGGIKELVYNNLYEIFLVDVNSSDYLDNEFIYPNRLSFISEKENDLIRLNYTINVKSLNKENFSNWFKEVKFALLNVHDKKGCILQKEFLSLDFESSELNFDSIDPSILEYNVTFNILSAELKDNKFNFNKKQIIREYKLNKLI
jgi:hypothetical protein